MDYIINEVICVLSNNFGKLLRTSIIDIFSSFYTDAELAEVKKVLLDLADNLVNPKPDEIKKLKNCVRDGKVCRDTEDVLIK